MRLSWINQVGLNPVMSVFIGDRRGDRNTEGDVNTEAERGVMQPQGQEAVECWRPSDIEGNKEEFSLEPPQGARSGQHLDFRLLSSRALENEALLF